jgi:hypothetical protein
LAVEQKPKLVNDSAKLKADIAKGLNDLAKGRVEGFDVERVVRRGQELLRQRRTKK